MSGVKLHTKCPNCSSQAILSTNDRYRNQICMSCGLKIVEDGILYTDKEKTTRELEVIRQEIKLEHKEKELSKYLEKYSC